MSLLLLITRLVVQNWLVYVCKIALCLKSRFSYVSPYLSLLFLMFIFFLSQDAVTAKMLFLNQMRLHGKSRFIEINIFVSNSMKPCCTNKIFRVQYLYLFVLLRFIWRIFFNEMKCLFCMEEKDYLLHNISPIFDLSFSCFPVISWNQRHKCFIFVILTMLWYFQVVLQTHSRRVNLYFVLWHSYLV